MSLPLQQFAALGFTIAQNLATDAFTPGCIVRLNPTITADPVADREFVSWGATVTKDLFAYDDEDERDRAPYNVVKKTFLLNASDYPPGIPFVHTGEIETPDGVVWKLYRVELAPASTVVMLYAHV